MRQIEALIAFLIYAVTGENAEDQSQSVELYHSNDLYKRLRDLVDSGEICQAENLLFSEADGENVDALRAALQFYQDINAFSDAKLASCNFSREEIADGLKEICSRYHISDHLLPFHYDEES